MKTGKKQKSGIEKNLALMGAGAGTAAIGAGVKKIGKEVGAVAKDDLFISASATRDAREMRSDQKYLSGVADDMRSGKAPMDIDKYNTTRAEARTYGHAAMELEGQALKRAKSANVLGKVSKGLGRLGEVGMGLGAMMGFAGLVQDFNTAADSSKAEAKAVKGKVRGARK